MAPFIWCDDIKKILLLSSRNTCFAWILFTRFSGKEPSGVKDNQRKPVPVELASIDCGPIEMRRMFSGTLEPNAEFVIAPKVSGREERLYVDLGDQVTRGQVVAQLDNDEYVQAMA